MRHRSLLLTAVLAIAACDRSAPVDRVSSSESSGGTSSTPPDASAPSDAMAPTSAEPVDASSAVVTDASVPAMDAAPPAVVGIALMAFRVRPTPEARGADATVDLELREDGSVLRRGQRVARFEGERLIDAQSREVLRLASDRVVMIAGMRTTHRLTDQGDLRRADGKILHVEDDGRVAMINSDGSRELAPMRIESFRPAARATATLLLMYLALQP
jgi:hypothetical protein